MCVQGYYSFDGLGWKLTDYQAIAKENFEEKETKMTHKYADLELYVVVYLTDLGIDSRGGGYSSNSLPIGHDEEVEGLYDTLDERQLVLNTRGLQLLHPDQTIFAAVLVPVLQHVPRRLPARCKLDTGSEVSIID